MNIDLSLRGYLLAHMTVTQDDIPCCLHRPEHVAKKLNELVGYNCPPATNVEGFIKWNAMLQAKIKIIKVDAIIESLK